MKGARMANEANKKPVQPRPVETGKHVENSAKPLKRPVHIKPKQTDKNK